MRTIILITLISTLLSCGSSSKKKKVPQQETTPRSELMPTANAGGTVPTGATIKNLTKLIDTLNLAPYHQGGFKGQNATVAILDNGYWGLNNSLGKTLPPDLKIEQAASGSMAQSMHGTKLAEIVYALTTGHDTYDRSSKNPQIKLYVTSGAYVNLEKAVNELIKFKETNPFRTVIALYAQIWEYGGNGDGGGYINALVTRAAKAGIIWVNAVGNLGKSTYFAKAERRADGYLKLPYQEKSIRFGVADGNSELKIVLAWDDFANTYYHYQTAIDLDLVIEDSTGKVIAKGDMVQDGKDHGTAVGYSRFARELVRAKLGTGEYLLKVTTKNIKLPNDLNFVLTVNGPGVVMENSNGYKKVFMPADNPDALTVGAYDVDYCNALYNEATKRFEKPDMWTPSMMEFSDGLVIDGSSTAAAVAAAVIAIKASTMDTVLTKAQVSSALADGSMSASDDELRTILGAKYSPDKEVTYPAVLRLSDR